MSDTRELQQKARLYMSVEFWSSVMSALDGKIESVSEKTGHGNIEVKFVIQDGRVSQVVFGEETRMRGKFTKASDDSLDK